MGRRGRGRERERDGLHYYSTTDRTAQHMTSVPSSLFSSNKRTRYDPQAHIIRTRYAYTETTLRFKEGAAVSMKIIPSHIILPHQHRFLTENDDVWSQNAWDHVPAPADQDATIAASLGRQRATPVPDDDKPKYNTRPAKHWSVPIPSPISTTLLKGNCDIGTTFTKRTPQTFSRTASGAFLLAHLRYIIGIVRSIKQLIFSRLHLEFPELVAAAESSVCPHPLVAIETQLDSRATHRPALVQSLK